MSSIMSTLGVGAAGGGTGATGGAGAAGTGTGATGGTGATAGGAPRITGAAGAQGACRTQGSHAHARDLSGPQATRRRLRVILWALVRVRYSPVAFFCVSKLGRQRRRVQVCAVLSLCRVQVAHLSRGLGASCQCALVSSIMQDDTNINPVPSHANDGTPVKTGPSGLGLGPLTACGHNSAHPHLSPAQLTIARALEDAKGEHGAQPAASHTPAVASASPASVSNSTCSASSSAGLA